MGKSQREEGRFHHCPQAHDVTSSPEKDRSRSESTVGKVEGEAESNAASSAGSSHHWSTHGETKFVSFRGVAMRSLFACFPCALRLCCRLRDRYVRILLVPY